MIKDLIKHFKMYIFRGLLTLIPIGLTIVAIRIIYVFIDKRIMDLLKNYIGYRLPGLGLFIFIIVLLSIGIIASNILGKKLFGLLDNITLRIPLINTVYQVGKQLSNTLSLPEKQIFKRVVLIEYFKPETWVIGFVTGTIKSEQTGENLLKVFVPTVPNPTSGVLIILKESQTIDPNWPIDETMKLVISGGIIGPEIIKNLYRYKDNSEGERR
ncbi:MAG: DUF502 domain-containing protein [Candidatus Auribacterota bacterium]|jgi:uncharacterized membrane protein|nr:DUF502 domain-containing protein [Candidatus Auribacterota bacterium]